MDSGGACLFTESLQGVRSLEMSMYPEIMFGKHVDIEDSTICDNTVN